MSFICLLFQMNQYFKSCVTQSYMVSYMTIPCEHHMHVFSDTSMFTRKISIYHITYDVHICSYMKSCGWSHMIDYMITTYEHLMIYHTWHHMWYFKFKVFILNQGHPEGVHNLNLMSNVDDRVCCVRDWHSFLVFDRLKQETMKIFWADWNSLFDRIFGRFKHLVSLSFLTCWNTLFPCVFDRSKHLCFSDRLKHLVSLYFGKLKRETIKIFWAD